MTLIEAIKSGKKFKRPEYERFYSRAEVSLKADGIQRMLGELDLDATDWFIEETTLTISKASLDKAIGLATMESSMSDKQVQELKDSLNEQLGLQVKSP